MEQMIKPALKRAPRWLDAYTEEVPLEALSQQSNGKHQFAGCFSYFGVMLYLREPTRLNAYQQQAVTFVAPFVVFYNTTYAE